MAGLFVHRSNRLEALGERLANVLRVPLPNPLQGETIVVQSLGMRRWISFELATRLGVTMNCRFPFFQEFAHGLLRAGEAENAFSRAALPWRILALLPGLLGQPGCEPLARYAGSDALAALKQFQLAHQVATVFDRYLAHSPERLLQWESTRNRDWQAQLWRALARGHAESRPPALLRGFIRRAEVGEPLPARVPPRLSVFGISGVPPFFLHLLAAAGKLIEVHLFLLEPTDQYWGDILSQKEQDRLLRRPELAGRTAEDLHFEPNNELLASFGRPGRAFSRDIEDLEPDDSEELFAEPERTTLLTALQSDIFQVTEPAAGGTPGLRKIAGDDRSLQIHCCHGPVRELEVLHDRLLELFERLPGLMPKDILVTMPEVELYAPFIESVFNREGAGGRLPFSIADRSVQAESSVAGALLQLLALHGGRFGASEVLALLEIRAVRERFDIAESELEDVRRWVEETGIRWGVDGRHRAALGLPPFEQNSWRAGLDRLLLGYALPGDGATLFEEVLPFAPIEGDHAGLLGRFTDFCEKLFLLVPALGPARPPGEWETALRELLDTFIADSDDLAAELKRIRGALRGIGALAEFHPAPIAFEVLRAHVAGVLGETESGFGFLAGHITFCSLKPMRSVPFRVICLLGLNDTAFPRREPPLGFDLLAQEGRGRSRRDDDRQLFLETILSARDALYLSYSGLSPRDNTESPPSVAVTELLDYTARNYTPAPAIVRHPLQPFSPRYFLKGGPLFSYSGAALAASRAAGAPDYTRRTAVPLGPPAEPVLALGLAELTRFLTKPSRFFLEQRLRVRLPEPEEGLDDCEPLKLDGLDRWSWQDRLAAGAVGAGALPLTRAMGILPAGWFGTAKYEEMETAVARLLENVGNLREGGPQPLEMVSLVLGEWTLSDPQAGLFPSGLLRLVAWKMKGSDRLKAWLAHLFLNAAGTPGPRETRLFCTDRHAVFRPVERSRALLGELLELYAAGLREPLPFFTESSFLFARSKLAWGGDGPARARFDSEENKQHVKLCFRDRDPLDARWEELAMRVYQPLIEHMEETKTP